MAAPTEPVKYRILRGARDEIVVEALRDGYVAPGPTAIRFNPDGTIEQGTFWGGDVWETYKPLFTVDWEPPREEAADGYHD